MHCMQLIIFYTFYSMKCIIFTVYKAIYSILYIQCTVLNLLHTIWCTPSIIYILWIIMCTYPYGVSDFQNVFKFVQEVSNVVTKGGGPPQKSNFKVIKLYVVSREAWHNEKGISSINPPYLEKTSKMRSNFAVSGQH